MHGAAVKSVYRATYSYMIQNPGVPKKGTFLVEAGSFDDGLKKSRSYLKDCIHVEVKELKGLENLGEIVSR
jgi:hypothetical protein